MPMFSFYIPMGILRSVSQQAVTKYPQSFLEKDSEGNIISLTTNPLLTLMRNRNYFLNRSPNTIPNLASNIPFKKRRQTNIFQSTCARWEIQENVPPKELQVMKSKQKYLKTLYENGFQYQQMSLIQSHMKDCFWLQRQYLNNMDPVPSIKDVQINWPFLFYEQCLCQHFEKLMEINANIFCENFKQSLDKFKKCFKSKDTFDSDLKIIKEIVNYFGKNPDFLFMDFEIGTTMDTIINKLPSNLPLIAIIETERAHIIIEKTPVAEYGEYDFINFVKVIFNYYFVLNKIYPAEISQTLEFLTRFCYKHYPNQTRGAKKT
ncbi:uncharacterized protein [Eurosta solidaginis]